MRKTESLSVRNHELPLPHLLEMMPCDKLPIHFGVSTDVAIV